MLPDQTGFHQRNGSLRKRPKRANQRTRTPKSRTRKIVGEKIMPKKEVKKVGIFECKTPCGNCPYRKDAPLAHWNIDEFKKTLDAEADIIGSAFMCHKQNGSICVGYLMNQDERDFPSNALRLTFIKHGVDREYLDALYCKSERFETIEEMCLANFPELKDYEPKPKYGFRYQGDRK